MDFLRHLRVIATTLALFAASPTPAQSGEVCGPSASAACPPLGPGPTPDWARPAASPPAARHTTLVFYWGVGCPHCEEAKPVLEALTLEYPGVHVERVEIRHDAAGRARFLAEVTRLRLTAPGIPLFVAGDEYVLGFSAGANEGALASLFRRAAGEVVATAAAEDVEVPLLGQVEARRVPLGLLTAVVGLADGLNPCAMWVLVVLLGVLANVRSRRRLLLFGGVFVLMSGVVYFGFMTAWSGVFAALGGSRGVTIALGVALVLMGLVNAKEVFLFKRGISLTIPERAKPGLYRRMRGVVNASSLPAALAGVVALALLANLVELGCTIGLPALYTRVLSLRDLEAWERVAWLAAYNVFYVVPLGVIVVTWVVAAPRTKLGERGARVLKGLSGVLLLVAGLVLVFAPHLLV